MYVQRITIISLLSKNFPHFFEHIQRLIGTENILYSHCFLVQGFRKLLWYGIRTNYCNRLDRIARNIKDACYKSINFLTKVANIEVSLPDFVIMFLFKIRNNLAMNEGGH